MQKHGNNGQQKDNGNKKEMTEICKYCGTGHPKRQCSIYGKKCWRCSKMNHFKVACLTMQRQMQGQRSPRCSKSVHEFLQD